MPMLPWPIWPLAWQARLGQNTVVGSTAVLLILAVKWIHRSMLGSPFASQWRPTTVRCGATLQGPTGGKLRYPAISSKVLPHTTLDAGVKHWEFFLLYPEPALFAFIWGCEPSKPGKKAR